MCTNRTYDGPRRTNKNIPTHPPLCLHLQEESSSLGSRTATMQAARFYGPGDIRVEEVDRPKVENDKVIVAVEWCGICGSDLSEYSHGESR